MKSIIFHIILTNKIILKVNFLITLRFIFNHHTNKDLRIDNSKCQESIYIHIYAKLEDYETPTIEMTLLLK